MASINKVIIVGNVGKDPETRFTADGGQITNLVVATSESWKDKSGTKQEKTEWHRITMFGKLAEIAGQYLAKGSQVYLEGKLQTRKWQDKDGTDRYTTEIIANEMKMLGGKNSGSGGEAPSLAPRRAGIVPEQATPKHGEVADFEDDIPF